MQPGCDVLERRTTSRSSPIDQDNSSVAVLCVDDDVVRVDVSVDDHEAVGRQALAKSGQLVQQPPQIADAPPVPQTG
jgi:hypothetical protein